MAVAMRVPAGTVTHEAEDLPGGEVLAHTHPGLPDGAHAAVCLDELITRKPHGAEPPGELQIIFRFERRAHIDLRQRKGLPDTNIGVVGSVTPAVCELAVASPATHCPIEPASAHAL